MTVVLISSNFGLSVASVAAFSAVALVGKAATLGFWPAAARAMGAAMLPGLLNGAIVILRLTQLYTDGRPVSVIAPEVTDVMKASDGGRQEGFWLVLIL